MKVLFVEARKKFKDVKIEGRLPKKLHIIYTIQYKNLAEKIRDKIKDETDVVEFQQVLGCSKIKPKAPILFIGSGKFHLINILKRSGGLKKKIFTFKEGEIKELKSIKEEVKKIEKLERGKLLKFYSSEKIGLLVSIKRGQINKKAVEIKNKLEKKFRDKKFYLFFSDNINLNELENFDIDIFINLACPGIEFDSEKIINYDRILKND